MVEQVPAGLQHQHVDVGHPAVVPRHDAKLCCAHARTSAIVVEAAATAAKFMSSSCGEAL